MLEKFWSQFIILSVWHFISVGLSLNRSTFLGTTCHIDNSVSIHQLNLSIIIIIFHFFAIGCGRFLRYLCLTFFLLHSVFLAPCSVLLLQVSANRAENHGCNYNFWHMSIWLFLLCTHTYTHNGFTRLLDILLRSIDRSIFYIFLFFIDSFCSWFFFSISPS